MPLPASRPSLKALTLAAATATAGLPSTAPASQGNIADTYGLPPPDAAPAQALPIFRPHLAA